MFFVFGSPRSGTTLLTSILNLHSEIVIPDETDFMVPLAYLCDRVSQAEIGRRLAKDLIVSTDRFPSSIGEYLSALDVERIVEETEYSARSIVWSLYDAVAKAASKRLAGDKRPADINDIPVLRRTGVLDDDCKIIHIVRDPRDVYLLCERQGWSTGSLFMHNWACANVRLNKAFSSNTMKYRLIRYEDFVNQPQEHTRAILDLLGVPWLDGLLEDGRRGVRYLGNSIHRHLANPITAEYSGQWMKVSGFPQQIFEGYEQVLKWFGYDA